MRTHQQVTFGTFVGVALLILVLAPIASSHAESLGAKLISTHGVVEVQGASIAGWVTASDPAVLPPGSALRTGPKSQAVLELDGAVITLYETSLIRIPVVASQASTATRPLRHPALDKGRAVFDVTPTPDHIPFSVKTPTIVAGVKGTVFEVVATGTQEAVYVWRGLVEVSSRINPDDVELVGAGQFTALDQLRLTLPSDIPFEREAPSGLETHPPSASERTHPVTATAPPVSGVLPTTARPDTLPVDEHSAVSTWPDTAHVDSITANRDHTAVFWNAADEVAIDNALGRALEIQTVVSSGSLRVPAAKASATTATDASADSAVVRSSDNDLDGGSSVAQELDDTATELGDSIAAANDAINSAVAGALGF